MLLSHSCKFSLLHRNSSARELFFVWKHTSVYCDSVLFFSVKYFKNYLNLPLFILYCLSIPFWYEKFQDFWIHIFSPPLLLRSEICQHFMPFSIFAIIHFSWLDRWPCITSCLVNYFSDVETIAFWYVSSILSREHIIFYWAWCILCWI